MDEATDSRRFRRIMVRFVAHYSVERSDGEGVLVNISHTGAMIEEVTTQLEVGKQVRITVILPDSDGSFELAGKVTRHAGRGFAIDYEKPHPDLCNLIDDAALIARIFR